MGSRRLWLASNAALGPELDFAASGPSCICPCRVRCSGGHRWEKPGAPVETWLFVRIVVLLHCTLACDIDIANNYSIMKLYSLLASCPMQCL